MKEKLNAVKSLSAGLLTGAVSGLFGGGGGMIAVPLLKNFLGYGEKRAHASAILLIAPVCLVSAIVYAANGFFRAEVVIPAAIGSLAGGFVGAKLLGVLPENAIKIIFVVLMLVSGGWMLF